MNNTFMDLLYENLLLLILTFSVYLSIWLIPKLVNSFLKGYLPEKGKLLAVTENFNELNHLPI